MLSKPPFTELLQNGFVCKHDFVYGSVNGYTTVVSYSWGERSVIKVDVLFDPCVAGQHMTEEMFTELRKRNKPKNKLTDPPYEWTKNSIGLSFDYAFKPPKYDSIIKKAEMLTGILALEALKPMKIEEAEKLSNSIS